MPASSLGRGPASTPSFFLGLRANSSRRGVLGDHRQALIMSEPRHQALIDALGAELVPVRRLLPPWLRTLGWLALVAAFAVLLFAHYGDAPMLRRWTGAP